MSASEASRQFEGKTVAEFQQLAEEQMLDGLRFILQCGAPGWGNALRANQEAWQRWALRSRALVDVSTRDTATTVLGERVDLPVLISPFAGAGICCADGEVATAMAAARAGTIMALSMAAARSPEEVGPAAGRFWMQLNFARDRGVMEEVVHRAAAAGACAVCLTVDLPVLPLWPNAWWRAMEQLYENGLTAFVAQGDTRTNWDPAAIKQETRTGLEANITWADLEWLHSLSPLPLVLKGIQTAEDARLACEHGAAAVLVSNHGGHALDEALGTADVLPEVAEAVAGRAEVLVDGGVRSGADVVRALALGARAVMVGRPVLWGLALGGADGATKVLRVLRDELSVLMGMVGARSIEEIDRSVIARRP